MALDSLDLNSSSLYGEIYSWAGLGLSPGMRNFEDEYSDPDAEEFRQQAAVVDYEEAVVVLVLVIEIVAFHPRDDQEETFSQSLVAYH